MEQVAGIIPTRGGSKGLPDKCMAVIGGHTLIHHAVRQALRTVGSAIVVTDAERHAEEAQLAGAVPVLVDYEVQDDALPEEQERRAMAICPDLFRPFSSVCRLFVTHPLRADSDILRGVGLHRETGDTVVSACRAEYREHQVVQYTGAGYWAPRVNDPARPRQMVPAPDTYLVGCFYVAGLESYRAHAFWPPHGFRVQKVPTVRAFDIDSVQDLRRAHALWRMKPVLDGLE